MIIRAKPSRFCSRFLDVRASSTFPCFTRKSSAQNRRRFSWRASALSTEPTQQRRSASFDDVRRHNGHAVAWSAPRICAGCRCSVRANPGSQRRRRHRRQARHQGRTVRDPRHRRRRYRLTDVGRARHGDGPGRLHDGLPFDADGRGRTLRDRKPRARNVQPECACRRWQ